MPLAFLLLLALSGRVNIVDQLYRIPADEWRYVELTDLQQRPALVCAAFEVESRRAAEVRLGLMRREDLEKLRGGLPHGMLAASPEGRAGTLVYYVPQAGDYVLVVDNSALRPATVQLRIWLDFNPRRPMTPTQLSPERRLAVLILSLGAFCGIAAYAGWRIWKGVQ
jgi:hypothetical protein